jgi:hypothetical protein
MIKKIVVSAPRGGRREIKLLSDRKTQPIQTLCIRVDKDNKNEQIRPCSPASCRRFVPLRGRLLLVPRGTYGQNTPGVINKTLDPVMSEVVYVSKSRIERKRGPLRIAHLPGEPQPVVYSVHGAIAEHYKVDPAKLKEPHASTIDYVISATAG